MRILVIEDNRQFLDLLRPHLSKHGFAVDTAETCVNGLALALDGGYEVILLDLTLPDGDGIGIVEELRRSEREEPILVLSARGEITDRIELLERGADDYLVKPFDLDELVARIRAVTRRGKTSQPEIPAFAGVAFDRRSRQAIVEGRPVTLRPREASLLEALLRRAGEPIHREVLLAGLYGLDEEIGSNTLDVHVHHLRRRLAEAGARVTIATLRGHGYALRGENA